MSTDQPAMEAIDSEYDCPYIHSTCLICGHEGCGWCPDCAPEVPEWT